MKIIVGLGNPGGKYAHTRHNVGFFALEMLTQTKELKDEKTDEPIKFALKKKFDAEIAETDFNGEKIILVKPQTFMNKSGEAVQKIISFYKANPTQDLVVVHDDVDIPLGDIRIKQSGSSAGHNGVQSIIDQLGTDEFTRVRIGVGRPSDGVETDRYVLQEFTASEREIITRAIADVLKKLYLSILL